MPEVPECLNRRYQALDELIQELSAAANSGSEENYSTGPANDPSVKLMCDFWNILKEDPDCNLTQAVRHRLGVHTATPKSFQPRRFSCYMATNPEDKDPKNDGTQSPGDNVSLKSGGPSGGKSGGPSAGQGGEKSGQSQPASLQSSTPASPNLEKVGDPLPLSKVLCNLKEAVSFDKKCNANMNQLLKEEKRLQNQIKNLESREKDGISRLKEADGMWSSMEDAYKKRLQDSQERQKVLMREMKEVEASNNKWRKNKKDLEFQLQNINKCYFEIIEKINEKKNDIKCINIEIDNLNKRIETNKKDIAAVKKSFGSKKAASDAKIANLNAEIKKVQKYINDENNLKTQKEREGTEYVKETRNDLQTLTRVLLQKKLENEDLIAKREATIEELEILQQTREQCKEKCQNKEKGIIEQTKKLDAEIAGYKVRCTRCHQSTDTTDARKFCTDCPRCAAERECLIKDGRCMVDSAQDCVCMVTKQKFLDNVFDNMYTVLERQAKTSPGKAVAQAVLDCLKRSRNGKLNNETRKILQDFVLTTVKKNLNLTIIGGAVKTRCEMDPENYQQLMLCLKKVKTVKAPKEDKGTEAKKEPCNRWGGTNECNCPKGPKACICTKHAPPPPKDPEPCPPQVDQEDNADTPICPHKDSVACGADCGMHGTQVGAEVSAWRPDPCDEKKCQFSKNMRAAQCVLGPESLSFVAKSQSHVAAAPLSPDMAKIEKPTSCKCAPAAKPCSSRKERKNHPRERIISEVMGRYTDVTSIEKVSYAFISDETINNERKF